MENRWNKEVINIHGGLGEWNLGCLQLMARIEHVMCINIAQHLCNG